MNTVWKSVVCLGLGFAGGILGTKLENRHLNEGRAQVVQATRFELVDSSGRPLAYLGQDKEKQRVLLAFVDDKAQSRAELGVEAGRLKEGKGIAYSPFTALIGSDGKTRMRLLLDSSQNPVLAMGDSKTESRLLLGHWARGDVGSANAEDAWDKWSLVFRDPSHGWRDYVDIGVTTPLNTQKRTGYLVLRNSSDRQLAELPK